MFTGSPKRHDSTLRAAWRRERAGLFCFFHARSPLTHFIWPPNLLKSSPSIFPFDPFFGLLLRRHRPLEAITFRNRLDYCLAVEIRAASSDNQADDVG